MKKHRFKKLKIIIAIIIGSLLIWNGIWYINYKAYGRFTSGYLKSPVNYVKSGDDFTYTVDPPSYLRFTGNFAITNNKELSLVIWPSLFMKGKAEYGIGILDKSANLVYRFYVDESMNYIRVPEMNYTEDEELHVKNLIDKYHNDLPNHLLILF